MSGQTRFYQIRKRSKKQDKNKLNFENLESNDKICIEPAQSVGPKPLKEASSNFKTLFLSLLIFRIFNCFINQTASVPDEYWQSVEIAHKIVFDIGYLTWEWLPEVAIRSPLYPILFVVPFKILKLLNMDNRILIIKIPLIMHAVLATISDFYLYKLSFLLNGQVAAQYTLFNQLLNWFTFYMCTRTLVNNLEWSLVTIGLYLYHRNYSNFKIPLSRKFLVCCALCFIIRPTSALIFSPLVLYHFYSISSNNFMKMKPLFYYSLKNVLMVGVFMLSLSLLLEKHFYGNWTMSQWNFLHFNLLTDVSINYGVHQWHWYWSNGLPSILTVQLIPLALSILSGWRKNSRIVVLLFLVVQLYSLLGHKEFRFIFPILPLCMVLIGDFYHRVDSNWWKRVLMIVTVVSQIPMMLYLGLLHQRGVVDVVMSLGRLAEQRAVVGSNHCNISAVFLMPCHSTPWMSYMHHNVSARFLRCDPQITGGISFLGNPVTMPTSLQQYDEADLFYKSPIDWLKTNYGYHNASLARPTYWIMFEQLTPIVSNLLTSPNWNYRLCKRFFHAHFPTHSKHSQYINVFCASKAPDLY